MRKSKDAILTILICCYDAGSYLEECLDSLTRQKAKDIIYKTLFINDASTDNSFEIAQSYAAKLDNFTLLNNKKNNGLAKSCNKALDIIDTPYFMRLDADDYLCSVALDKITEELSSPAENADFIIFNRWDVINGVVKEIKSIEDMFTWIAVGNLLATEAIRSVGGYSDEYWEEYDLYIKLLEAKRRYRISPYRIYYYRRGHESMTQDYRIKKQGFADLSRKWEPETLKKYGDIEKMQKYYGIYA